MANGRTKAGNTLRCPLVAVGGGDVSVVINWAHQYHKLILSGQTSGAGFRRTLVMIHPANCEAARR